MHEHEVPTHVQAEDRVLLWFTFPQLIALAVVAALGYGVYHLSELAIGSQSHLQRHHLPPRPRIRAHGKLNHLPRHSPMPWHLFDLTTMHKVVFAIISCDKSVILPFIKPLYLPSRGTSPFLTALPF